MFTRGSGVADVPTPRAKPKGQRAKWLYGGVEGAAEKLKVFFPAIKGDKNISFNSRYCLRLVLPGAGITPKWGWGYS